MVVEIVLYEVVVGVSALEMAHGGVRVRVHRECPSVAVTVIESDVLSNQVPAAV
ncbi:hypothetical protein [Prescottella agglutinans]|uniref:Uncharacterized protein n=1 Tax=Prescottella agglutinans TaxID=1644129 RepID=A0ABT6MMA5_9NOCA|nr:hypothetical protein [Prescottella agglutinans]MDH6284649.1 hypothetical protein [Prescottella agglutinans]